MVINIARTTHEGEAEGEHLCSEVVVHFMSMAFKSLKICSLAFVVKYLSPPSQTEKVECLNSMFVSKFCVPNPLLSVPTLPSHIQLFLGSVLFF